MNDPARQPTDVDPKGDSTVPEPAFGGDIILSPGAGWSPKNGPPSSDYDGKIRFRTADGTDLLVLAHDKAVVYGKEIPTDNAELVWETFVAWITPMVKARISYNRVKEAL